MRISTAICIALMLLAAPIAASAEDAAHVTHLKDPSSERVPVLTVAPVYPQRALRDRLQGDVEVCFNVDREGRTSRIAVRSSSHRVFEKPAMQAVRASTYAALAADEELSGIKTCRTFRFRLDPVAIEDPGTD